MNPEMRKGPIRRPGLAPTLNNNDRKPCLNRVSNYLSHGDADEEHQRRQDENVTVQKDAESDRGDSLLHAELMDNEPHEERERRQRTGNQTCDDVHVKLPFSYHGAGVERLYLTGSVDNLVM